MKARKLGKPSPGIIVAVLALVAALAGTAVAGPSADTAVSIKKVNKTAKKALKKAKKNKQAIADIELTPGPQGEQGDPGPKGDKGDAGATNVVRREASSTPGTTADVGESVQASCEPGEVPVGGGAIPINVANTDVRYVTSGPAGDDEATPTAWFGTLVTIADDANGYVRTFVVCASP